MPKSFRETEEQFSEAAKKYFNETLYPEQLEKNPGYKEHLKLGALLDQSEQYTDEVKARVWVDHKQTILDAAKKETRFEGVNLDPKNESHDNWFITKYNTALSKGNSYDGTPDYHVQLFGEVNQARNRAEAGSHKVPVSIIPEELPNKRVVIKTLEAVQNDPELSQVHKDAITKLNISSTHDYPLHFEIPKPERAVMVYHKNDEGKFELQDVFTGRLEISNSQDSPLSEGHISNIPLDLETSERSRYNNLDTSNVNILLNGHYNPQVQNSEYLTEPVILKLEKDSMEPTPESAKKFLNTVKDKNLAINKPDMPENVLMAALEAVNPALHEKTLPVVAKTLNERMASAGMVV